MRGGRACPSRLRTLRARGLCGVVPGGALQRRGHDRGTRGGRHRDADGGGREGAVSVGRVLVDRAAVHTGNTLELPAVLLDERERLDERTDGVVAQLVFEDDEAGRLGAGDPLLQVLVDTGTGRSALLANAPVFSAAIQSVSAMRSGHAQWHLLLVPNHGVKAQDLLGDGDNTVIRITVGRTPVLGEASAGGVVDDLHRPCELADNRQVAERGHVWVCPCVDRHVTWRREGRETGM